MFIFHRSLFGDDDDDDDFAFMKARPEKKEIKKTPAIVKSSSLESSDSDDVSIVTDYFKRFERFC